jgi:flagellar basal-body rod protein FlgF
MDNSAYIALSRQLTLFRDMDVTANNIANANTTGYDAEHIVFNSYLTRDVNQGDRNPMAFAHDISTYRNLETGPIKATGNQLDIAIQGNGYFAVRTPMGTRYTRAGNFQIGPDGTLVTTDGYPVLNTDNQIIVMPDNTDSIKIGEAGNVKVNGEDFGSIAVVKFANPQLLERLSGKLFKSDIPPQPADAARLTQGMLESSNVQPVAELTHMMTLSHTVTDTAQFVAIIYDLERKTAEGWVQQS